MVEEFHSLQQEKEEERRKKGGKMPKCCAKDGLEFSIDFFN